MSYASKILVIFIMLALPLVFMHCDKQEDDLVSQQCASDCTTISGTFTTRNGVEGIAGIGIKLNWHYSDGPESSGISRSKAISTTDEHGGYVFNFSVRDDEVKRGYYSVTFAVDTAKYLSGPTGEFWVEDLKRDTAVTVNYLIPRKALVQQKILNLDKISGNDFYSTTFNAANGVNGEWRYGECIFWQHSDAFLEKNTSTYRPVAADQPLFVWTVKVKDGVRTERTDTIILNHGTLTHFVVDFND